VGLQELAGSLREASCEALADRVNHVMQRDLMREVMRPSGIAHLENPATTDLISVGRDTFDQWLRPGRLAAELTQLVAARGVLLGAAVVLTSFQWWAGPAFGAAVLWAEHEGRQVARKAAETHYGSTQESRRTQYFFALGTEPPAAKEVRVFGLPGFLLGGFQGSWNRAHAEAFAGSSRRELFAAATLALVCLAIIGWLCVLAAQGRLGIGQAVVEAQAVLVGLTALGMAGGARLRSELALRTIGRYEQAMAAVGEDRREPGTRTLPARAPLREIRFENVSFRYPGSRTDLLRQLDLVVPAGRSLAIVGDNGVGKTTLLKLLCGLYPPTGGRILVDGVDLRELDPRRWQRHIAAVFQDNVRYPLSAASNVALGAVEHQDDLAGVREVAETAGIAGIVDGMERGWDTVLSTQREGGSDLSGGEWQKLALARALFAVRHGAGVLILDEPAAHLDARSEARLFEHYLELTRGVTTIVVSHRFSTVRRASSIVVIRDGRIAEQGTHDDLVRLGGHYAAMFRVQASSFELTADQAGGRA
jgi:ATP-binding cassette subfamily B protein